MARRSLLDRALRERASGEAVRQWAKEAKREVKQAQQSAVASLVVAAPAANGAASEDDSIGAPALRCAAILAALREAGEPNGNEDLELLQEIETLARELRARPRAAAHRRR